MTNAFRSAGASVNSITFSGFHGEERNPLPGWRVYDSWNGLKRGLYQFFIGVSIDQVVPSEYPGRIGAIRYALFSHLSIFAVTAAAVSAAARQKNASVFLPEPLTLFAALDLLRRRHRPRIVATVFAMPPNRTGWTPNGIYARLQRWSFRRLLADGRFHFVVQTQPLLVSWQAAFGAASVSLIPIGVGGSDGALDRTALKQRMGLPVDKPLVAVLGAIRPAKGYIELLSAFRGHPRPCYFLLAGDWADWAGPDPREVARANGCEADTIFWLRFLSEDEFAALISAVDVVATLYRNADGSSG